MKFINVVKGIDAGEKGHGINILMLEDMQILIVGFQVKVLSSPSDHCSKL